MTHKHNWFEVGSFPDRYTRTAYYECSVCGKIEKRTEWWADLQPKTIGSQGGEVCALASNKGFRCKIGAAVNNLCGSAPTDL